jgi:YVTN family beta-propeller protein
MNDFERRIADALKDATSGYQPGDPYEAKATFLARARRRRIAFGIGSAVVVGAAAALALIFAPQDLLERTEEPLPPAITPEVARAIPVGSEPSGLAFGNGQLWVANTGDGTVSVVDPVTNSVIDTIDVGGHPDDVAVGHGAAWVSDSGGGTVTKIAYEGAADPVVIPVGEPGNHLDIAEGVGAIWVVSDGDSLYRIDPATDAIQPMKSVENPADVSAGQDRVMVLGGSTLVSVDPLSDVPTHFADVAESRNQDLQMSDGAVWVANGDTGDVTRYDLASGVASEPIYVGGNFTAIASGEGSMWMVSGDEGDDGVLTRIDPATGAIVGERTRLGGRPYDVTTGAGSVWVANYGSGSVTRLDPDTLPTDDEPAEDVGRPLFAFSADGNIYVESVDGDLSKVTNGGEDVYPSLSPDGNQIVFQRGDQTIGQVVLVDILNGDETILGPGSHPAFAPDGRIGYVRDNVTGNPQIVVMRPGSSEETNVAVQEVTDGSVPAIVSNLAWDLTGDWIYYISGWEGFDGLYQSDPSGDPSPFELVPGDSQAGSLYRAPTVRGRDSVHTIRACCTDAEEGIEMTFEQFELGLIRFTEGGPQYETVMPLNGIDTSGLLHAVVNPAGRFVLSGGSEEQRSWRQGATRSWIVSTSAGIWMTNEGGEIYDLDALFGFETYSGVSMASQFRQ